MTPSEFIIKDIKDNHWPRVGEGLAKGYIDENQILVIYDHAVRAYPARIRTEKERLTVEVLPMCVDEYAQSNTVY